MLPPRRYACVVPSGDAVSRRVIPSQDAPRGAASPQPPIASSPPRRLRPCPRRARRQRRDHCRTPPPPHRPQQRASPTAASATRRSRPRPVRRPRSSRPQLPCFIPYSSPVFISTLPRTATDAVVDSSTASPMEAMPSYYQAVTLVALPSHPNSIAWSQENLVAIASEHLITILNPASLAGARGVITLLQNKPFHIGLVDRKDLLTPCLTPICLSRDVRPYARSISWSPPGFAPNSGCFLGVCTGDGRVKLYRAPYCEYTSEWIEVVDISELLFDHLTSINYGERCGISLVIPGVKGSSICSKQNGSYDKLVDSTRRNSYRRRKRKGGSSSIEGMDADSVEQASLQESNANIGYLVQYYGRDTSISEDNEACPEYGNRKKADLSSAMPHITAEQYASRSAALSSLIVAWSPVLQSSEICCAILAVGSKSGAVSFWRIDEPLYYTIEHANIPVKATLIGLIQAHNSWVTAICFGISAVSPDSQLFLATGSSDGSLKIWSGNVKGLLLHAEVKNDCFSLLAEVTTAISAHVSTIDLVIPVKSPEQVVLAVGRGSGMVEVWIIDIASKELCCAGGYNAHDQVLTGLAWAFDGCCLYSCSQDNSIRSWIFHGNSLYEAPLCLKFPASDISNNLLRASDLCFGLALSPGDLMLAVVRSLDANFQHQMYEKRSQRAVVEFFWTGGQSLEIPNDKNRDIHRFEVITCSSQRELACWEINILWSLNYFGNMHKPLVIWDMTTLLLVLRKVLPGFVENIITKWISSWLSDPSLEKILFCNCDMPLMIDSHKMQLLNIICRRVMLCEIKVDEFIDEQLKSNEINNKGRKQISWNELLIKSERELQERVMAFTFQAVLNCNAYSHATFEGGTNWFPNGVAQMEQWAAINHQMIHSQIKPLRSEVTKLRGRNNAICEYVKEESCGFCSASVPFECPEEAWCEGIVNQKGSKERHKLTRCAVSMRLCSVTVPLWFCMCCRRWAASLLPLSFFTMVHSPLDSRNEVKTFASRERLKPLCPFCGILLQRSMPDFLLSASPV